MKKWEKPLVKNLLLKATKVIGYIILENCISCPSTLSDPGYKPLECYQCLCCKEIFHGVTTTDMDQHVKECRVLNKCS